MNEFRELLKKKNKKIEEVNKNTACIKIQALWRGYRAREQILDLEDAVIIIQAYWKGQLERRKFKQLVRNKTSKKTEDSNSTNNSTNIKLSSENENKNQQIEAATKIQAIYRGFLVREHILDLEDAGKYIYNM